MRVFNLDKHNKSVKTSAASDFVGGYVQNVLSELPPQDELSDKQIKYVRDMGLSSSRSSLRGVDMLSFYVRYPRYFFLSLYDLEQHFRYYGRDDIFEKAWNIYLTDASGPYSFYIPTDMSYRCVEELMDANKISSLNAAEFFLHSKRSNEKSLVELVARRFPEEYARVYGDSESYVMADIKAFLEHPSISNQGRLKSSMQSLDTNEPEDLELLKKIKFNFIMNGELYKVPTLSRNHRDSVDGGSLLGYVDEALESIKNGESLNDPDNPFIVQLVNDPLLGNVAMLYYNGFMVDVSALDVIRRNVDSDHYYEMSSPSYSRDKEVFGVPISEDRIYLIDEDSESVTEVSVIPDMSGSYDYSAAGVINRSILLGQNDNANLMIDYVRDLFSSKRPEVAFNELMKNELFKTFMSDANSDFYSVYVHNYRVLSEDSTERNYSTVLPFNMNAVFEIWKIIPEKFRHIPQYGTFYICSGLFPCSEVYEKVKSDLKHSIGLVEHIKGSCSQSENLKLRKQIIEDYENMKSISRSSFDDNIKEFLSSRYVQKKSLSDFPNLQEYCAEFLNRNLTNTETYDYYSEKMVSSLDKAIESISKVPIYLIDGGAMKRHFSEDVLKFLKFNPDECNGFYSSYFAGERAIVVYSDKVGGDINEVLGEVIGLNTYSEDSSLNVETESTLWHEMSHALSSEVVSGPSDKSDTMAEWMSSSDEVLAMSYGNLQYIKNKLREFFTDQFPFNKTIESGFINEIKSGIINTFPIEFDGATKEMALKTISDTIPNFNSEVLEMINNMSKDEKINYLVNMFTEFFMGRFLRGKVEEHFLQGSGEEKLTFKEERVIPDKDAPFILGQKDEHILDLENRSDYQEFLKRSKRLVADRSVRSDIIKRFVHKSNPSALIVPTRLSEVLMMIFDLKGAVRATDVNRQGVFYRYAPTSLIQYLKGIVQEEKEISEREVKEPPPPQVPSPEEAEETGRFMAEQDEKYGPDWMWLANNSNWYKLSKGVNYKMANEGRNYWKT